MGSPLKKARASLSGMGDEDLRARFGMMPSATASGLSKDGGLGLSGVGTGTAGVRADVLGNIEHDRFASAGSSQGGNGAQGHSKNASFGSLLGGMLANGGAGQEGGSAATGGTGAGKEVKMEEEEEL